MSETKEEIRYVVLEEIALQCIKDADYKELMNLVVEYEIFDKDEIIQQLVDNVNPIQIAKDLGYEL